MKHPDPTHHVVVCGVEQTRARGPASLWAALSLGAAVSLCAIGTADAAYYGYGYGYGYGYRPHAAPISRHVARKKAKKPRDEQVKKEPARPIKGPLTVVVSIGEQRVRVFDSTSLVAESPTSTGQRGFPTPMGVFSIIQKDRYHRSNLYNGAPMPYMQRITWSGTAMHTGVLPGYPASHGCIRLPNSFAMRLWGMTKLGTRVIVARHGLTPLGISHATLDNLKRKPAETIPVAEGAAGKVAANDGPVTDGFGTPMPGFTLTELRPATPLVGSSATDGFGTPMPAVVRETFKPAGSAAMTGESRFVPATEPVVPVAKGAEPAASPDPADFVGPPKPLKPGPIAMFISKKEGKLFVRKGFEPIFDIPVAITNPEIPLGTHIFTATEFKDDGLSLNWISVSLPAEQRAEPRAEAKRGQRHGEKKPVAKPAPVQAVAATTASEALGRVTLPQEALDRLAELLSPGANLVISDKGLGPQTGKGTDFIVLSR